MTKMERMPVWSWRDAIRRSPIEPTTKLLCYTLANYMSDAGQAVFPSVKALMEDSGLSNRSVATHLQKAADAGLLLIERRHDAKTGHRIGSRYLPCFPSNAELARVSDAPAPNERPSPRGEQRRDPNDDPSPKGGGLSEKSSRQNRPSFLDIHLISSLRGEALSFDDLKARLVEALGTARTTSGMAEPQRWLAAGYDLERDILPTIRAKAAAWPAGKVLPWAYFTAAIADAKAARLAPAPDGLMRPARRTGSNRIAERQRMAFAAACKVEMEAGFCG